MRLVIGGKYQDKLKYAVNTFFDGRNNTVIADKNNFTEELLHKADIITDLSDIIMSLKEDETAFIERFDKITEERPDICIICDETGSGIIPLEKELRLHRDRVGHVLSHMAEKADIVVRVFCGQPQILKEAAGHIIIQLIRHGMTADNHKKLYVGRTDTPLDEEGIRRLKELRKKGLYHESAFVYTSPLLRACQSAAVLFPEADRMVIRELREMEFGIIEGRSYDDLKDEEYYRRWIDSRGEEAPDGTETVTETGIRMKTALEKILLHERKYSDGKNKTVPVISHGGAIMALMAAYNSAELGFFDYMMSNGRGYEITSPRSHFRILDWRPL